MVFNATFNNISVISWRTILLEENQSTWRKPQVGDKLYHIIIMLYRVHLARVEFKLATPLLLVLVLLNVFNEKSLGESMDTFCW